MPQISINLLGLHLNIQLKREIKSNFQEIGNSWQEAQKRSIGYGDSKIFEKAIQSARMVRDGLATFERDTVTFQHAEFSHQMLAWMLAEFIRSQKLTVLDFGGGFGSRYFQHKKIFDQLQNFKWGVIEQENIVSAGQQEFSTNQLCFASNIDELITKIDPNFLLISSSLQYIEQPYEVLRHLLQKNIPKVLLDRTMARSGFKDEVFIQQVPPSIYSASYPVWFLDADRIEREFQAMGYQLVECIDPFPGTSFGVNQHVWPYKSWFFELKKS